ncbi:Crp/Fnr family transcriptional regulator [Taibaiella chishuiensis]|uniref:CRP-like cAMP-binding protein n=1 Tax=Taibaiella chishuiensis TaxID=1434707 RepID=A0A2P8CZR0_9BACT|nr:Crp/Fnr family transcriptional regulator [Taibaiella chishuiensis]PSK90460.1 CRP-like cAMP-binding protein [Taibaiella chishuiensis]
MYTGPVFPSHEWHKYIHLFKRLEVPARTVLLQEGDIAKRAFFVLRGCLRVCFNNKGRDITTQFFFEGQGVASIESFRTGKPSLFGIETIEPCLLYVLDKKDYEWIITQSDTIRAEIEHHIFNRLLSYQHLFISRIKDSPEERYHDLLEQHPEMLQRIPQHYIASYLGITPVSLSRIRNRR